MTRAEMTMPDSKASLIPGRADRILLLGVARSGTSWLARALGHAEGARLVGEPDNVNAEGYRPYQVIDPDNDAPHFRALWDLSFSARVPTGEQPGWRLRAGRVALRLPPGVRDPLLRRTAQVMSALPRRSQQVVVKSIYAHFTVDWLLRHYQPRVIVIQRHPLNVVSSWMQLGLQGFNLLSHPLIRQRYLDRLGIVVPPPDAPPLQLIATYVGLLTTVLAEQVHRHPEWLLVTHEDLCREPQTAVREVCERAGLEWNDDVSRFLDESNRPGEGLTVTVRVTHDQPSRWRGRLADQQVGEIEAVLAQFPSRGWVRPSTARSDAATHQ